MEDPFLMTYKINDITRNPAISSTGDPCWFIQSDIDKVFVFADEITFNTNLISGHNAVTQCSLFSIDSNLTGFDQCVCFPSGTVTTIADRLIDPDCR